MKTKAGGTQIEEPPEQNYSVRVNLFNSEFVKINATFHHQHWKHLISLTLVKIT